jgi:hypothetical protein
MHCTPDKSLHEENKLLPFELIFIPESPAEGGERRSHQRELMLLVLRHFLYGETLQNGFFYKDAKRVTIVDLPAFENTFIVRVPLNGL